MMALYDEKGKLAAGAASLCLRRAFASEDHALAAQVVVVGAAEVGHAIG
jgi:hypothetical protein